jgi:release factor glutamine methyltransferase
MAIYEPAEDSDLLAETIKDYLNKTKDKNIKILDLGSGSGIQAETCKKLGFKNILTADISQEAVKHLKKLGFKSVQTDLFSKINKHDKFDLVIFNPPYLPDDKLEPKDSKQTTTAGKHGYELILKFLKQAKSYLNKDGAVLLLFSSLSRPNIIKKQAKQLGYNLKLLNKQKIFFEELFVYELMIRQTKFIL